MNTTNQVFMEGKMKTNAKKDSGFTLVEVVVATFILVLGFLSLSQLVISSMQASTISRHTVAATSIGQSKMEELLAAGYDSVSSGSETVDSYYTVAWTSTVGSVNSVMNIDLSVGWTDHRGTERSVELSSLVSEARSGLGGIAFTNIPVFSP